MTITKNASYDTSSEIDKLHTVKYQNSQSGSVVYSCRCPSN